MTRRVAVALVAVAGLLGAVAGYALGAVVYAVAHVWTGAGRRDR